ncbi:hypothetical protein, partial [Herbaspirillum sp. B65]|uniref:hypothetical protein n=1 Tax=Herbaspirillum sp. B65 TaxID=137708 RepID=UPI001C270865
MPTSVITDLARPRFQLRARFDEPSLGCSFRKSHGIYRSHPGEHIHQIGLACTLTVGNAWALPLLMCS